jgi:hypothetical protein
MDVSGQLLVPVALPELGQNERKHLGDQEVNTRIVLK